MEASILDLRYRMREVLQALGRRENVRILYHGKVKGTIVPSSAGAIMNKVAEHPFFGMHKDRKDSVEAQMTALRKNRYDDL